MKRMQRSKKARILIKGLILTLALMNIGTISSMAEPASYEEAATETTQPETAAPIPESPTEPVSEEPTPEPEPEIIVPEPETPEPETPEPEPATETIIPETTVAPETTAQIVTEPVTEPQTAQPEVIQPETEPQTTKPQTTQSVTEPQTTLPQVTQPATESPTTQPETTTEDAPEEETKPPVVIVTGTYTPVPVSFANETEIANNIRQYLEENEELLTELQKGILQACINTTPASAGYCAQWVRRVYAAVGIEISGNANDLWTAYCESSNKEELEPGMLVAVPRSSDDPDTWGYDYGQAGIYVGNGMIVYSSSIDGFGVKALNTLDDWIAEYDVDGKACWGYPTNTSDASASGDAPIQTNILANDISLTETALQAADVSALTSVPVTAWNFPYMINLVPSMTKEELVALGTEMYGIDSRWMQALIGTTVREGYYWDPYLYYTWACAMLNDYRWYSADALYAVMTSWGGVVCPTCGRLYSEHAVLYGCRNHLSYSTTSEYVLKCVYLAMINRDYRVLEVDGMIPLDNAPSYLGLIYNSPVYNCQVWTWIGG